MQRTLAAFGLGAALLFGVHGERAMEHAGDIQQLGAIDFADVEQKTKKLGEAEDARDLERGLVNDEKRWEAGANALAAMNKRRR